MYKPRNALIQILKESYHSGWLSTQLLYLHIYIISFNHKTSPAARTSDNEIKSCSRIWNGTATGCTSMESIQLHSEPQGSKQGRDGSIEWTTSNRELVLGVHPLDCSDVTEHAKKNLRFVYSSPSCCDVERRPAVRSNERVDCSCHQLHLEYSGGACYAFPVLCIGGDEADIAFPSRTVMILSPIFFSMMKSKPQHISMSLLYSEASAEGLYNS